MHYNQKLCIYITHLHNGPNIIKPLSKQSEGTFIKPKNASCFALYMLEQRYRFHFQKTEG